MKNNLLKLEKITKNFGNVKVLKEVDIEINTGAVTIYALIQRKKI